MLTKSFTRGILFSAYVGAVLVSVFLCDVKFRSLGFQNRDYALYLEFASKILDEERAQTLSINPEGTNFLYMRGTEGAGNIHRNLHFEPIKYIYAFVYRVFQTPYALFIFIAIVFFSPLLYLTYAMPLNSPSDMLGALTLGTLYLLLPSTIHSVAFDLRPYIFLAPFFLMTILSIRFSRPPWEQIFWFNALFLAREEAVILGAIILLFCAVSKQSYSMQPITFIALCISYFSWTIATAAFLRWTEYPVIIENIPTLILKIYKRLASHDPLILLILILSCGSVAFAIWILRMYFKRQPRFQATLEILSLGSVFFPLSIPLLQKYEPISLGAFFYEPRYFLHYIAIITLSIATLRHFRLQISEKIWSALIITCGAIIVLVHIVTPGGFLRTYTPINNYIQYTDKVWSFKMKLDPYNSKVLADYATHQAFYDFENIYAYNRLPWHIVNGKKRHYPANQNIVRSLIEDQIEFIIISRVSLNDINSILENSSVTSKMVFENQQFIGLEIIRK